MINIYIYVSAFGSRALHWKVIYSCGIYRICYIYSVVIEIMLLGCVDFSYVSFSFRKDTFVVVCFCVGEFVFWWWW